MVDTRDEEMTGAAEQATSQNHTRSPPQQPKKSFKIGGRTKSLTQDRDEKPSVNFSPKDTRSIGITPAERPAAAVASKSVAPSSLSTLKVEHEETPEEKAERRRLELKRKNDELVKKQSHKKKRRF